MIEFFVLVILILFVLYLLFLLTSSALTFIVNIILLVLILPRVIHDIKKRKMFIFYLLSAILTTIIFIAKDEFMFKWLFGFMEEAYLLAFVQALFLIFLLAIVMSLAYFAIIDFWKKYTKKS